MTEERYTVELNDNFYRDSFAKVVIVIIGICLSMAGLAALSLYLYLDKPPPLTFFVDKEMRVLSPVPLNQPYLSTPDLLQWVVDVLPKSFVLDFNHYDAQLQEHAKAFSADGWKAFLNQLNIYANYTNVQAYKLFVTGSPAGAPSIVRQGVIPETGKYGWWVQMPVYVNYAGYRPPQDTTADLQLLVVRTSTLNNLTGVEIDRVIPTPPVTENSNRNE